MFVARGVAAALWCIAKGFRPSEAIEDVTGRVDFIFPSIPDGNRRDVVGPFLDAKDSLRVLSEAARKGGAA
jgi:hypothetical protein